MPSESAGPHRSFPGVEMVERFSASILVREFDPADQAEAAELINSGLGYRFGLRDDSKNPDLYDIHNFYRDDCFLVAVEQGRIVGTGGLIYEGAHFVRIVRMHTLRAAQRRGVGSAVLDALESRAVKYGAHEIFLETDLGWDDAHAFYRARGYSEFRRNDLGIRFHKILEVP